MTGTCPSGVATTTFVAIPEIGSGVVTASYGVDGPGLDTCALSVSLVAAAFFAVME